MPVSACPRQGPLGRAATAASGRANGGCHRRRTARPAAQGVPAVSKFRIGGVGPWLRPAGLRGSRAHLLADQPVRVVLSAAGRLSARVVDGNGACPDRRNAGEYRHRKDGEWPLSAKLHAYDGVARFPARSVSRRGVHAPHAARDDVRKPRNVALRVAFPVPSGVAGAPPAYVVGGTPPGGPPGRREGLPMAPHRLRLPSCRGNGKSDRMGAI